MRDPGFARMAAEVEEILREAVAEVAAIQLYYSCR
jgi:hypothetical protein